VPPYVYIHVEHVSEAGKPPGAARKTNGVRRTWRPGELDAPSEHVSVYRRDADALQRVRRDLGVLLRSPRQSRPPEPSCPSIRRKVSDVRERCASERSPWLGGVLALSVL